MITKEMSKTIDRLVEQKIFEFFGDPDNGLSVKKNFLNGLKKRLNKKQKLVSHELVMKKYGVN